MYYTSNIWIFFHIFFTCFLHVFLIFNSWNFNIGIFLLRSSISVQLSKNILGIINKREESKVQKLKREEDVYLTLERIYVTTVFTLIYRSDPCYFWVVWKNILLNWEIKYIFQGLTQTVKSLFDYIIPNINTAWVFNTFQGIESIFQFIHWTFFVFHNLILEIDFCKILRNIEKF